MFDALQAPGERTLDRTEAAGVSTGETSVLSGAPSRAIVRYTDDRIVTGRHGRTGLDRVLLGSVTERVVRVSGVP